ncbi:hypothetical protein BJ170DRAFT_682487 [Xylariales sp. AK1849]|nr:hypothetical protein BJ170DRAFT_682487 [Xylariales sp. AK1849]
MGNGVDMKNIGPRACTTCAKAKARCIPCENPLKCERCDRLNKPCSQQTPALPRQRKAAKATRVAQLEKKLDDLSSQLRSANVQTEDAEQHSQRKRRELLSHSQRHVFSDLASADFTEEWPAIHRHSNAGSLSDEQPTVGWPQGSKASKLLDAFRDKAMPLFPFVIVPPGMSAEQLRRERPFVWKAVMVEACGLDGGLQVNLGRELLGDLGDALLTRPRKSLDLLQGLLLFLTWFPQGLNSFQVTNLLGLARSLCLSLGFDEGQFGTKQPDHIPACLEQMRAFAGTYYLVTTVFGTSKRPDALMNTTYVESICHVLEKKAACPTDELLVYLIKIQQLAQAISWTFSTGHSSFQTSQISMLPIMVVVRSFQTQIEEYKASLPTYLQDHSSVMAHIHIAEILLYEVGLQESQCDAGNLQATDRLELLCSLRGATKSFIARRFGKTSIEAPKFVCISSFEAMYAFITSLKLVNLQAPGWDLVLVRQYLALDSFVDRQIRVMEALCERRKLRQTEKVLQAWLPEQDPFYKLVCMLKGIKAVLETMPEPTIMMTATQPPSVHRCTHDRDGEDSELTPEYWQVFWSNNMLTSNDPNVGYYPGFMEV